MPGRAILVIPQSLLEKIDAYRGEMSRAEFIDFCIEALIREKELEEERAPSEKPYRFRKPARIFKEENREVTKEEFEEFKRSIAELQRSFIEFFTTYSLEALSNRMSPEEQERFRQQVKRLLEL